jgi:hypothetical protein
MTYLFMSTVLTNQTLMNSGNSVHKNNINAQKCLNQFLVIFQYLDCHHICNFIPNSEIVSTFILDKNKLRPFLQESTK